MLAIDPTTMNLDQALADFAAYGYAPLGQVLSASGIEVLSNKCIDLMLGHVRYPDMFFQHDAANGRYADLSYGKGWIGPSLAYRKVEGLERDEKLCAWIENPLFARIAGIVLGDAVSLYRAVLWNKAAHAGTELPWHQDDGRFWGIDRPPCLQIWTALDDADEGNGCVEIVPGSHLNGLASAEGGTVQAQQLERAKASEKAVKLQVKAGEAVLIHNHVWHRSGRNSSDRPRRAIGISYLDAATRCMRRKRAPRTFRRVFAGITDL